MPSMMYDPQAQLSHNVQAITEDYGGYEGGSYSRPPFRPAIRVQSFWGGIKSCQSWADLDYPPEYRVKITQGALTQSAQVYLLNNMPQPIAFAPIAIQEYALQTQMVYQGTAQGGYNEYGG